MLIVLSPAKTLDFEAPPTTAAYTQPVFIEEAQALIEQLRALSANDIADLMSISAKLGELNYQRFQTWQQPFTPSNAKQAALAFKGDVYTGLDAESLGEQRLDIAQSRIRILSGLYGLLKPLDLIQPYRLEMGTKFKNHRGKNLYEFWGDSITEAINRELEQQQQPVLVNLASNEYFKAVKAKKVNARIITPHFKDMKNGQYKMISFYAKKARGMMAAFALNEKINTVDDLKEFNTEGYEFNAEYSDENNWTFTRNLES
tara:strand:+ start:96 stop:872 length:777 start_codon:yes stop_codon:yes gene_type:complete